MLELTAQVRVLSAVAYFTTNISTQRPLESVPWKKVT